MAIFDVIIKLSSGKEINLTQEEYEELKDFTEELKLFILNKESPVEYKTTTGNNWD